MEIHDHLLHVKGTPVRFVASPNVGGELVHEYLVMHYTASQNLEGSISWLTNPKASASAHVVIGRDGSVTQLIPFHRMAWHAGRSSWGGRTGMNRYSIGIELENAGKLTRQGGCWRNWCGQEFDDRVVVEATHKHERQPAGWHIYSEPQIEAAIEVACAIVHHYGIREILGHEDVAPGRKVDPGPAFPMDSFRARVLGRMADDDDLFETTTALNIRRGPGTDFDKLPHSPLPKGTRVAVQAAQGTWLQGLVLDNVLGDMDVEGWMHASYLRKVK